MAAIAVAFRPVTIDDLPVMHGWLSKGPAREWYGRRDRTFEEVRATYMPIIRGAKPTLGFIMSAEGTPIGYIQTYWIRDHPDYARQVQVEPAAAGVDLFIGESGYIGRGLGSAALRTFLAERVFADAEVSCCYVGPDPANAAAIRCYEKVGFRYVKSVTVDDEPTPEYLMRIERADVVDQ